MPPPWCSFRKHTDPHTPALPLEFKAMKLTKPTPRNTRHSLQCRHLLPAVVLSSLFLLTACTDSSTSLTEAYTETTDTSELIDTGHSTNAVLDADFETPDWTVETHSKDVDPNFNEVFDDMQVKRLQEVQPQEQL